MNTSIIHLHLPRLKNFSSLGKNVFMVKNVYLPDRIVDDLGRFKSYVQIYIYSKKSKPPLMCGYFTYGFYNNKAKRLVTLYIQKTQGKPDPREFIWKSVAYATEMQDYSRDGYRSSKDFDLRLDKLIPKFKQIRTAHDELQKFMIGPVVDEVSALLFGNFNRVMAAARACGIRKIYFDYDMLVVNNNNEGFVGYSDGSYMMFSDLIGGLGGGGCNFGQPSVLVNGAHIHELFPPGVYGATFSTKTEKIIKNDPKMPTPFFKSKIPYKSEYVWDQIRAAYDASGVLYSV